MLLFIYLLVVASSFFISLIRFNAIKTTPLKYFPPFLLLTIAIEIIGYWQTIHGIKNYTMFNIFTTFEFEFYFFIFFLYYGNTINRILIVLVMLGFPMAVYYNLAFIQGFESFHSNTFLLGSFFMVLFSLLYLFESVSAKNIHIVITEKPFFWVCTGYMMFYLGSVIINSMFEYLRDYEMLKQGVQVYGMINHSLNLLLYTGLSYAFFICNQKTTKYYIRL